MALLVSIENTGFRWPRLVKAWYRYYKRLRRELHTEKNRWNRLWDEIKGGLLVPIEHPMYKWLHTYIHNSKWRERKTGISESPCQVADIHAWIHQAINNIGGLGETPFISIGAHTMSNSATERSQEYLHGDQPYRLDDSRLWAAVFPFFSFPKCSSWLSCAHWLF